MVIDLQNTHGAGRIDDPEGDPVEFLFEGKPFEAFPSDTIAAALLAAGVRTLTVTEVSGDTRGGFCFLGRCADCMVIIDGQANQRACITPVRAGMDVRIQHGQGAVERQVTS